MILGLDNVACCPGPLSARQPSRLSALHYSPNNFSLEVNEKMDGCGGMGMSYGAYCLIQRYKPALFVMEPAILGIYFSPEADLVLVVALLESLHARLLPWPRDLASAQLQHY